MGKSKTKRFGSIKPSPLNHNSENSNAPEPEVNGEVPTPSALANIIEKLQAASSEEKACGCQLMAGIVSQPKAIGYLLKENVVRMTAPLFLDKCLDVQKSALGALRNMSVYGHADVSEVMLEHDILTPLTALLHTYGEGWRPEKDASKYDTSVDVLIEALELLSNLCESSNLAVKRFNKENLLTVLLPLLDFETYKHEICIAAARCLLVVSENNNEVAAVCQKQEVIANLLKVIDAEDHGIDVSVLKIYAAGILLNLPETDLSLYYGGIVKAILKVLDLDSFCLIHSALQSSHLASEETLIENNSAWPDVDRLLSAQGLSLELLANLCCTEDEWEDTDKSESEESISDEQVMDTEMEHSDVLCLPSEITSAFLEQNVWLKILEKISPLDDALESKLQESHCGKSTLKKLHDLRTRALLCIGNIVGAMDETLLSQSTPLTTVCTGLYQLLLHLTNGSIDEDLKWAATSALRAVIQRLAEVKTENFGSMPAADIDFLMSLAKTTNNRETQINIVKIISTLGCHTGLLPNPLLQKVGTMLLEMACHSEDLIVVSEALDSLFDVFKEDDTDTVAKEIGLVNQLMTLQSSFRQRIKEKRKAVGENKGVVMMAKANLAGFIKYKLSQS